MRTVGRLIGWDGKIGMIRRWYKEMGQYDYGKRWEIDGIKWQCNLDYTGI